LKLFLNKLKKEKSSLEDILSAERRQHIEEVKALNQQLESLRQRCGCDILGTCCKSVGEGWFVFQRRQDGSVDFYRSWEEYKEGFGNQTTEFWWGLEKLHAATRDRPRELCIDLEDFSGNKVYAHYTSFRIAAESNNYVITVSGYNGTAGDALDYHNGKPFSTKDRDNDGRRFQNCAERFDGAWWMDNCYRSHLNAKYKFAGGPFPIWRGPVWSTFNNKKAVKFTEMKLR